MMVTMLQPEAGVKLELLNGWFRIRALTRSRRAFRMPCMARVLQMAAVALCAYSAFGAGRVTVAADGSGNFRTVQAAVNAAPGQGTAAEWLIAIRPGIYREHLEIGRPFIHLLGLGRAPEDVVLTFDLSNRTAGNNTGASASTVVTGDDFTAENLTFENTYSRNRPLGQEGSQAVALRVGGDRAVFKRVRFLGYQDTLYAQARGCETEHGPCRSARQYFEDCYIEGNVDFIFGDSLAWFENCEIRALAHKTVYLTAQSKRYQAQASGYVFHNCRVTAEPGAEKIYLGRPWRWHSSVVFLNTQLPAQVAPEGWLEWIHEEKISLPTAFYAEFASKGPGANTAVREPHAKQLTAEQAAAFKVKTHLQGWEPR